MLGEDENTDYGTLDLGKIVAIFVFRKLLLDKTFHNSATIIPNPRVEKTLLIVILCLQC